MFRSFIYPIPWIFLIQEIEFSFFPRQFMFYLCFCFMVKRNEKHSTSILRLKTVRVTDFCDESDLVSGKSQYCWLFIMTFALYHLDIQVFVRWKYFFARQPCSTLTNLVHRNGLNMKYSTPQCKAAVRSLILFRSNCNPYLQSTANGDTYFPLRETS